MNWKLPTADGSSARDNVTRNVSVKGSPEKLVRAGQTEETALYVYACVYVYAYVVVCVVNEYVYEYMYATMHMYV